MARVDIAAALRKQSARNWGEVLGNRLRADRSHEPRLVDQQRDERTSDALLDPLIRDALDLEVVFRSVP